MNFLKLIFAYGNGNMPYYEIGRRDYYKQRLFPKEPESLRTIFNYKLDLKIEFPFAINGLQFDQIVNQELLIEKFGKPRFTLSSFDKEERKIITETLFYKWNTRTDKTIVQFTFFENNFLSCCFEVRSLEALYTTKTLFKNILGDSTVSFHNTKDIYATDSNHYRLHLNFGVTPRITIVSPEVLDSYIERNYQEEKIKKGY